MRARWRRRQRSIAPAVSKDVLRYVILPQVRGGIAVTVVFFVFLNCWDEFLFAVQLSGNHVRPVTVAMYNFVSVEQTLWAKLSAASLIAMVPVIAIGFQRSGTS